MSTTNYPVPRNSTSNNPWRTNQPVQLKADPDYHGKVFSTEPDRVWVRLEAPTNHFAEVIVRLPSEIEAYIPPPPPPPTIGHIASPATASWRTIRIDSVCQHPVDSQWWVLGWDCYPNGESKISSASSAPRVAKAAACRIYPPADHPGHDDEEDDD